MPDEAPEAPAPTAEPQPIVPPGEQQPGAPPAGPAGPSFQAMPQIGLEPQPSSDDREVTLQLIQGLRG
jgi:hypothetical protein